MKTFNFASLNVNGLQIIPNNDGPPNKDKSNLDLTDLTADLHKHNIAAIAVQETHFKAKQHLQNVKGYKGFFSNDENDRFHGIGILVRDIFDTSFVKISGRVSAARFQINDKREILFICGYAPHEPLSIKTPKLRKDFYEDIEKALKLKKSNTIPILALDANAQIDYYSQEPVPGILGNFTKGKKTNTNGQELLQLATKHNLAITNTMFQHKMSRRTTWTANFKIMKTVIDKCARFKQKRRLGCTQFKAEVCNLMRH